MRLPEHRYEGGEDVITPENGEEMEFEGDLEAEARRSAGGSALSRALVTFTEKLWPGQQWKPGPCGGWQEVRAGPTWKKVGLTADSARDHGFCAQVREPAGERASYSCHTGWPYTLREGSSSGRQPRDSPG